MGSYRWFIAARLLPRQPRQAPPGQPSHTDLTRSLLRPGARLLPFLVALLALHAAPGQATTYTVTDSSDNAADAGSIRYAINQANGGAGNTVSITSSVTAPIVLTSAEIQTNVNMTISNDSGHAITIQRSTANGTAAFRIVEVAAGTATINGNASGLTITNGISPANGNGGGALVDAGATANLSNCTLSSNSATQFGGGVDSGGTTTLTNCTLNRNTALQGGGVYSGGGTVTLANCTLSGNSSTNGYGGGMLIQSGTATLTNCSLSTNSASGTSGEGGGVYNAGTATLTNCTLSGNSNQYRGGGVANNGGTMSLTNCTLSGNSATDAGGAVINDAGSSVTLSGCTMSGNTAPTGNGGGLENVGGSASVSNCTFSGNSAVLGGAVRASGGTVALVNCTLAGNSGPQCSCAALNGAASISLLNTILSGSAADNPTSLPTLSTMSGGTIPSLGHNLSSDDGGGFLNQSTDQINTNPQLLPLGNYGGPTQTMKLMPSSPALDAGDDSVLYAPYNITTDQRGVHRPQGFHVDIGAFELEYGADIAISLSAPSSVSEGGSITYSFTVSNHGPGSATGVTLTDTLPAGVTYTSATSSQGTASQNGGVVTIPIGTITSGASVTGTIVAKAPEEGSVTNTAMVYHDLADPQTFNNVATASTTVGDSAVSATGGFSLTGTEGTAITNATVATFTDPGGPEAVGDYSASINWGDGAVNAGTIAVNAGVFSVAGSHTYALDGSYTITVTISHDTASNTTTTSSATIADADTVAVTGTPVTGTEGAALTTVQVATFTAKYTGGNTPVPAPASVFTASIDWGDGTSASTGTVTGSNGSYAVAGSHTYTLDGSYTVRVTVTHAGTSSSGTSTATIADADVLSASAVTFGGTEGQTLNNVTVAKFSTTYAVTPASDFSASINWGDGSAVDAGNVVADSTAGAGHYLVVGTHTYAIEGSYPVKVTVSHSTATPAIANSTATIVDADTIAVTGATVSGTEGQSLSNVQVAAFVSSYTGTPASGFSATIDWGDGSATSIGTVAAGSHAGSFVVTGTHTYVLEGSYAIKVTVSHAAISASNTSTANIADADTVSVMGTAVSGTEGTPLPGVQVATFSTTYTPSPASSFSAWIDWGDGTPASSGTIAAGSAAGSFTVTGSHTYAQEGSYPVKVTVSHAGITPVTGTSTATILDADVLTATAVSISGVEGQALNNATVAKFSTSYTPSPLSSFSASIDWGDGSAADTSANIVADNAAGAGHYLVTGNHTYSQEGPYTVKVTVSHGTATPAVANSTANIADADAVSATGTPVSGTEGTALSSVQVATFTSSYAGTPASAFSASIDWGDGTTSAGTVAGSNGSYAVTGSHTYTLDGSYTIKVTISHAGAPDATVSSTATIASADVVSVTASSVSGTEGQALSGVQVATFTSSYTATPASGFTVSIDWGDGTAASAGTVAAGPAAGSFTVTGSHTYVLEDSYNVKVTVSHPGAASASGTSTATIVNADTLSTSSVSISGTEGQALNNATVAKFSTTYTASPLSSFSASIDWGDGSAIDTSANIVADNAAGAGHYLVTGNHTYSQEGPYTVKVTVSHSTATPAVANSTANIADADAVSATGTPVSGTEGVALTGVQVATFTSTYAGTPASSFSASIDWGDGTTSTGSVAAGTKAGSFLVTGSHTYALEGSYTIKTTVSHGTTPDATATSTATIADADTVSVTGTAVTGTEGTALSGAQVATFTSSYTATPASGFTASIDWGDGSAPSAGTVTGSNGTFTVTGGHSYSLEGSYTVKVTVSHAGTSSSGTGMATIADADTLSAAGVNVSGTEGQALSGVQVATFTSTYTASPASSFSATIDWGDGTATSAGTVTAGATAGSFIVTGSHTYALEGSYTVKVTASHGTATPASATSTAAIADTDSVSVTGNNLTGREGTALSNVQVATFTTSYAASPASSFSATIDWGDGTTSAGTITAGAAARSFIVTGSHTYANAGSYTVKVSISHNGGPTASTSLTAAIADLALVAQGGQVVPAVQKIPFSNQVLASFTDPHGPGPLSSYSASIDWGDNSSSPGSIAYNPTTKVFTVLGSHTYARMGTYHPLVTIQHGTAPNAVVGSTALVGFAWKGVDVSVGTDGHAHVLWSSANGQIILWSIDNQGHFSAGPVYNDPPGATPRAVTTGADNITRLLWNNSDGSSLVWMMNPNNSLQNSLLVPAVAGWTVIDIAANSDKSTRLLWSDGRSKYTLWSMDSSGNFSKMAGYVADTGYTAKAMDATSVEAVLLVNGAGAAEVAGLDANDKLIKVLQVPAQTGFTPADIAIGADGKARLLWNAPAAPGSATGNRMIATLDASGNLTNSVTFGPYPNWTALRIAAGSDGMTRMIDDNVFNQLLFWVLNSNNSKAAYFGYTPAG